MKNAVFPRFCASCSAEGTLLCSPCATLWQPTPITSSRLTASFNYADPVARELIRGWKYSLDATAWVHLQKKLGPATSLLKALAANSGLEAIVPIPLHRQRKLERGFDQAEEISMYLSELLNLPMLKMLVRSRMTGSQVDRESSDRVRAMVDSPFSVQIKSSDLPSNVLLVDDVWTTGATAMAAAQVLKEAGVRSVWFYMLAKGG